MTTLPAAAREWLGVPFRHQGRSRNGIDCVGLCVLSLRACGFPVDDVMDYPRDPDGRLLAGLRERLGDPVSGYGVGDIVVAAFPKRERHIAILGDYVHGGLSIIHAWSGGPGRVVEVGFDNRWQARVRGVYRPDLSA